ncbi:MAG: hypothetical protein QXR76_04905 [Candidatus Bathyarchaeia archaeon]
MIRFKLLLAFFMVSLALIAFLGCESLRLTAELQSLSESYHALGIENAELLDKYQKLSGEFNSLNQTHYTLVQNYTELSTEYQKVLTNYVNLMVAYTSLNETYYSLLQNYTELESVASNYTELLNQYQELTQNYQSLLQNYTKLKDEYDVLYTAFYEPLLSKDKVMPTVDELTQWLTEDPTNEITYTYPDFVCGDYAVMLHMHAKLKHWDMGVVGVLGNLSDGSEFNHAFNAIICKEGLRYIEPQNDRVFEATIENGLYYNHPGFGQVYVREFIVIILFDSG